MLEIAIDFIDELNFDLVLLLLLSAFADPVFLFPQGWHFRPCFFNCYKVVPITPVALDATPMQHAAHKSFNTSN